MFLYQSRLLKAGVSVGVLTAQFRMINLYTSNLNSVGAQAGFIASLSYMAIQSSLTTSYVRTSNIAWAYQVLFAISVSSALIMISHCILASMMGPTKALVGKIIPRHEQEYAF